MSRFAKLLLGPGVVALLLVGLIAAPGASAARCKSASNIEAIIDDSGSMEITDPDKLRVQAMSLLIDDLSPSTQLGAVEFGSGIDVPGILTIPAAATVFAPGAVGANAASMRSALDAAIKADNGATDYNGAFAKSDADNPSADARVFLTDGGHDVGTYNEGHLVHKVPTYVIGFGSGIAPGADQARLKKIAKDTHGKYFPVADTSELQAAMNSIGAALTCQTPPRQFTDLLKQGQSKVHKHHRRRGDQDAADHPHLGEPAGQIQAQRAGPDRQTRPARGRLPQARQAEGDENDQLDVRHRQDLGAAQRDAALQRERRQDRLRCAESDPDHAGGPEHAQIAATVHRSGLAHCHPRGSVSSVRCLCV